MADRDKEDNTADTSNADSTDESKLKIHFNQYGVMQAPNSFWEASRQYVRLLRPLLDNLTIVEMRAASSCIVAEITGSISDIIIRKQMEDRIRDKQ